MVWMLDGGRYEWEIFLKMVILVLSERGFKSEMTGSGGYYLGKCRSVGQFVRIAKLNVTIPGCSRWN